jgi:alkanesulfonate monooxygenase SsuD/methylene tetrahydromethanopterin reductase-like flavin-dependent oxidoreductase (luciferase family)
MKFGVSLSLNNDNQNDGGKYTAGFSIAERLGFDSLWFFDSLGRGTFRPDPISGMSAAAAVTETIEIGTCILQVPLRHPIELAHRVLSAHYLSGGRLLLGVGSGSTKTDFEALGLEFESRFQMLKEALPVMQRLWRGETVQDVNLTPLPSMIGGPPILIGSWAGSRWIPVAAKQYDGWIGSAHFTDIATLKEGVARFRGEHARRSDRGRNDAFR